MVLTKQRNEFFKGNWVLMLQPWTKIVTKTKNFPFPQLSMLFLGMRCKVPEDNNIETGGRVFSEVGWVMQENNVFAKIFCSGCLKISKT